MTKNTQHSHQFHLVDPSPWPITMAFSLLMATGGAVLFFHDYTIGSFLLPFGVLCVFFVMYRWWKDVITEAIRDKAHNITVQYGLRIGMSLFILSEIMFFFAMFFSFFMAALMPVDILDGVWGVKQGVWPPQGIEPIDPWDIPLFNTLLLLLSGTTVTWAHYSILNDNRKDFIRGLTFTVMLGVIFSCVQIAEYIHAPFAFADGVYGANFYMTTGFHGFHVLVGTIFLTVCLIRAKKGQMDSKNHLGFEFAAWYWHFVDVVWLFLYVSIYIWGRG